MFLIVTILRLVCFPVVLITAINVLFPTAAIPITPHTWAAMCVICLFIMSAAESGSTFSKKFWKDNTDS